MPKKIKKSPTWFVYLMLIVITLAVFLQVCNFEFINYDDNWYVFNNNHIFTGLTWQNVVWVFTSAHGGNWHPLTGLSHILDCQLFGLKPGPHHFVNLLFHTADILLLFAILRQMTGTVWQSMFVTALFAIHPLHVESVAWISERKDVLSTLFWLLTMAAYFHYIKNPKISRYILTLVLFALGLMSKPMLVTLPFVLLLLDYWPLNRLETDENGRIKWWRCGRLIWEKTPFFILSAVSSFITFSVQKSVGAVQNVESFPLPVRLANAVVAYAKYIEKMFWPSRLTVFYPYSENELPLWSVLILTVLLLGLTVCVLRLADRYRYLPVGWFWYLGTLIPVIGLVQVSEQSMADHYTYVPLVGLFIIVAWGTNDLLIKWNRRKVALGTVSVAVIVILSVCAAVQTSYWKDGARLFEHALEVTGDNYIACNSLAVAKMGQSRFDEAVPLLLRTLRFEPANPDVHNNLGVAYGSLGRSRESIQAFEKAIEIKPDYSAAYYNLGTVYDRLKSYQDAIAAFEKSARFNPNDSSTHFSLGLTCLKTGDKKSALKEYQILKSLDTQQAETLLGFINKGTPP